MRNRSARLAIPAAVLATAALALTGCSSHGTSTAATSSVSTPSSATGDQSAPSGGGGITTGDSSPTTGSTSNGGDTTVHTQSGSASSHDCASSQLKVSLADRGVGAGQFYAKIVFTNTASTSCTLTGYPGVSYVATAGKQSGNPATRTSGTVHTVTLAGHGSASALMHDSNGLGGYSPSQCQLTSVEGLRIYPPNQKGALFLPWKTKHCAGTGIHPLTIAPVQS
jgi:Protein of unknown function (DUF4232)